MDLNPSSGINLLYDLRKTILPSFILCLKMIMSMSWSGYEDEVSRFIQSLQWCVTPSRPSISTNCIVFTLLTHYLDSVIIHYFT